MLVRMEACSAKIRIVGQEVLASRQNPAEP